MKIIKRGQLPEEQLFAGTCSHCKTKFECTRGEGQYESGRQRGEDFLRVECPLCYKSAIAYAKKSDALAYPSTSWYGMDNVIPR